jgi:hypothetical protein
LLLLLLVQLWIINYWCVCRLMPSFLHSLWALILHCPAPVATSAIILKAPAPVAPSAIILKAPAPVATSAIILKAPAPVAPSAIILKAPAPVAPSAIILKATAPVATSAIILKAPAPVATSAIQLLLLPLILWSAAAIAIFCTAINSSACPVVHVSLFLSCPLGHKFELVQPCFLSCCLQTQFRVALHDCQQLLHVPGCCSLVIWRYRAQPQLRQLLHLLFAGCCIAQALCRSFAVEALLLVCKVVCATLSTEPVPRFDRPAGATAH